MYNSINMQNQVIRAKHSSMTNTITNPLQFPNIAEHKTPQKVYMITPSPNMEYTK